MTRATISSGSFRTWTVSDSTPRSRTWIAASRSTRDVTSTVISWGRSAGRAVTLIAESEVNREPPVASMAGASPTNTSGTSIWSSMVRSGRKKSTWMARPLSGWRWTDLMIALRVPVPGISS